MLGTSLWYALYGSTLASESAFEDRMSALSREIGSRGRADAVATAADVSDGAPEPCPQPEADGTSQQGDALHAELSQLRPSALRKRARAAGVARDDIEKAEDAEEPQAAFIALIVSREGGQAADLAAMKPSVLKKRARAAGASEAEIEAAEDADDAKAATIALVLAYENAASAEP